MHPIDHIVVLLLFVVLPIYGARGFRRFLMGVEQGSTFNRIALYLKTIAKQWTFLAALFFIWLILRRPLTDLGFVAPGGIGFSIGAVIVVVAVGLLIVQWQMVRRSSHEAKVSHRESFGMLKHMLPNSRRSYRYFIAVSITAGIVEEVVYRGYVLWYLELFMPLWIAVLVSSIAFGLGHSYQGISGTVKTGVIGLCLALLYVFSGSIWLPIVAHALMDVLMGAAMFEILRGSCESEQAIADD